MIPPSAPVAKDPTLKEAYRRHVKGNSLYRNNGDGTFAYTGDSQGDRDLSMVVVVRWDRLR